MLINRRNLRLAGYLSEHYGEKKYAREVFRDLNNQYGHQLGFNSPQELTYLLKVYCNKVIRQDNGPLRFMI